MQKKIYINENQIGLLKEYYSTPDSTYFNGEFLHHYNTDAYPFEILFGKLFVGNWGSTHMATLLPFVLNELGFETFSEYKDKLKSLNDDEKEELRNEYDIICDKYEYELNRNIHGRIWINKEIISFWNKNISIDDVIRIVDDLKKYFNKSFDNLYICVDGNIINYEEFLNSNKNLEQNSNEIDNALNIHLANQKEKKKALSNFIKNRDNKVYNKLGNMTMAQYHNLKTIGDDIDSKNTTLNEYFNHEYDNVEYIKLYHGTSLESVNDILENGFIDAKLGKMHGETSGINWFSTKQGLNFYRGALFSIIVPKSDFENHIFNFMNNSEVISYEKIDIKKYNFKLERVGEFSNLDSLRIYLSKCDNDLWEFYNRLISKDIYFNEIEYLDITQPLYIQLFKQLGITEDKLKIEGFIEDININENLELEVEPNEVDLSSFEKKKQLNPSLWKNNLIDEKVRLKLLHIADDFYKSLGVSFIKPTDIILCGSMCNYNWSEYSDIDLHILIDFSQILDNNDIIKEYFDIKKNEWNNEHDELNMYGFKVELYVQDENEPFTSSGIYSLEKNEWIKEPSINDISELTNKRQEKISKIVADIMTKIDDYYIIFDDNQDDEHKLNILSHKIDKLFKNIKEIRKNGLKKYGELSLGNIIYKAIRRANYFDKLWDLKIKIYDKINSIP